MANDQPNPLDDDSVREYARQAIRESGLRGAAKKLGVNRQTVLALAAGTAVSRGSLAIVREHLRNALATRAPGETP